MAKIVHLHTVASKYDLQASKVSVIRSCLTIKTVDLPIMLLFSGDFESKILENPKWKCTLCKIFLQSGHCNRMNCDYAHGEQELRCENPDVPKVIRGNYKTVMCNNWGTKGFCHHENSCTFAHGEHELNAGKDAGSALKLIRDVNLLRKRPKSDVVQSSAGFGQQMNMFQAPSMADQKLFAEFLEFKKLKQQSEANR